MQTLANKKASIKYRKSKKGIVSRKNEDRRNGNKRALRYFYSEKGYSRYLSRVFNVQYKDWLRMNVLSDGVCMLCLKKDSGNKRLCIDHDHLTGKFRGLLCGHCNKGLGHFRDNPELLIKAARYIQTNKDTKELVVIK